MEAGVGLHCTQKRPFANGKSGRKPECWGVVNSILSSCSVCIPRDVKFTTGVYWYFLVHVAGVAEECPGKGGVSCGIVTLAIRTSSVCSFHGCALKYVWVVHLR